MTPAPFSGANSPVCTEISNGAGFAYRFLPNKPKLTKTPIIRRTVGSLALLVALPCELTVNQLTRLPIVSHTTVAVPPRAGSRQPNTKVPIAIPSLPPPPPGSTVKSLVDGYPEKPEKTAQAAWSSLVRREERCRTSLWVVSPGGASRD